MIYFSVCDRHRARMAEALAALEARKDEERNAALASQKAEMEGLVQQANAERDEHLANYAKVDCSDVFYDVTVSILLCIPISVEI